MARKAKLPISEGVRKRFGLITRDADDPITLPLPGAAIACAAAKRREYDVDDPDNFTACAIAECLAPLVGGEVLIMRRYAYVALEGERFARRYQLDTVTADVVKANDLNEFQRIEPNITITLRPPTPGRRLNRQGGPRVSKKSRGILANPPKPHPDPYRRKIRNGVHAAS